MRSIPTSNGLPRLVVLLSCLASGPQVLAQQPFVLQPTNPVLAAGPAGSWDDGGAHLPHVVDAGNGVLHLFYTGRSGGNVSAIGLATSTDGGRTWTKHPNNPMLGAFGTGYAAGAVGGSVAEFRSGQWVLYFGAWTGPINGPSPVVGRATAPNPWGPWTPSSQPVHTVGVPGEWDAGFVTADSIHEVNGRLRMYYTGGPTGGSAWAATSHRIGFAESTDGGLTWTKYDDPTTTAAPFQNSDPVFVPSASGWDAGTVHFGSTLRSPAGWEMFYAGFGGPSAIGYLGYATSADGIGWQRCFQAPVLRQAMGVQKVLLQGSSYVTYFTTFSPTRSIHRAVAPDKIARYGAGCPGSGGFVPRLTGVGCPQPGGPVSVVLDLGAGGSLAGLFLGGAQARQPLCPPCDLLLSGIGSGITTLLSGPAQPGAGSKGWCFSFPSQPGTAGLQAFVLDPGAACGFTASNGLWLSW